MFSLKTYVRFFIIYLAIKIAKNVFYNMFLLYMMSTYNMHIMWRFQINISKIAHFIGKKAQKID